MQLMLGNALASLGHGSCSPSNIHQGFQTLKNSSTLFHYRPFDKLGVSLHCFIKQVTEPWFLSSQIPKVHSVLHFNGVHAAAGSSPPFICNQATIK
ncbi:hypothetical protein FF1_000598 [Malus domestica]